MSVEALMQMILIQKDKKLTHINFDADIFYIYIYFLSFKTSYFSKL